MMRMMRDMTDRMLGRTRLTVAENERAIVLVRGRLTGVLGAGEHLVPARGKDLVVERHGINAPVLASAYERALLAREDLAGRHLTVLQAAEGEVAAALRDGRLVALSRAPMERVVLWTDAGPWQIRRWPVGERLEVPEELCPHIEAGGWSHAVTVLAVERGQVGLLTIGGQEAGQIGEGRHLYWALGRKIAAKLVDTRWRLVDVAGQEVLTADRVTLRVNVTAHVRVTDPGRAARAVHDHEEAVHRALQLAVRRTIGARTLDRLLAEKVEIDAEAAEAVRAEMAGIGIEVGWIALKDVILPGEMREILNQVVAAEKAAEANVIRRREETQATRALLNTAKVMAENPVMLRLKELEALTELAGKVERLTVHNGTAGLMNDLVRLRD